MPHSRQGGNVCPVLRGRICKGFHNISLSKLAGIKRCQHNDLAAKCRSLFQNLAPPVVSQQASWTYSINLFSEAFSSGTFSGVLVFGVLAYTDAIGANPIHHVL